MPLSDLLPGAIHDLVPVAGLLTSALDPDLQATNDLVLGHAIPVEDEELEGDVLQTFVVGHVEEKGLIEDRVQRALLHVGLLLGDALSVVQEVDLHVGICGQRKQGVDVALVKLVQHYHQAVHLQAGIYGQKKQGVDIALVKLV